MSEYLVKPVLKADFVETLERILEKCFESEEDHSMEGSGCLRDKKDEQ